MQRAQLTILGDRQVARIARYRSEVQAAPADKRLEPGMRDNAHVMTGGPQSGTERHVRTHITLRTDSDDSNAHVDVSSSCDSAPERFY
jgi:hypothetical protein